MKITCEIQFDFSNPQYVNWCAKDFSGSGKSSCRVMASSKHRHAMRAEAMRYWICQSQLGQAMLGVGSEERGRTGGRGKLAIACNGWSAGCLIWWKMTMSLFGESHSQPHGNICFQFSNWTDSHRKMAQISSNVFCESPGFNRDPLVCFSVFANHSRFPFLTGWAVWQIDLLRLWFLA